MQHLVTYQPIQPKRRIGRNQDGGYVVADGLTYDAFISCGISDEVSFDTEFTSMFPNIPAFAFDGTVDRPTVLPSHMVFQKINIATYSGPNTTDLKDIIEAHKDIFLKMDIEGHEWRWILSLTPDHLRRFKQITMEVHGLWDGRWESTLEEKVAALAKLTESHYLVHVHANNHAGYTPQCPYVLELTLVRKDVGVAGPNRTPFPVPGLDYPNGIGYPDIPMTNWPFVTAQATTDPMLSGDIKWEQA